MDKGMKKGWQKKAVRAVKAAAIAVLMATVIFVGPAPVFASGGAGVVTGINTLHPGRRCRRHCVGCV